MLYTSQTYPSIPKSKTYEHKTHIPTYQSGMYGKSQKIPNKKITSTPDKEKVYQIKKIDTESKKITTMYDLAKDCEMATHKNTFRSFGNQEHITYLVELYM